MKPPIDDVPKIHDTDGLHRRRGTWYFCLTVAGTRRFFSTRTKNYQDARKAKSKAEQDQRENRLPTDLAKLPFEKLLHHVMEDRKRDLAANSIRIEKERSGPLLKHFTGRRVSSIDAAAIRTYQIIRVKVVGNRTVNLETKLLRQVLRAAKTWSIVADDYKPLKEDRRGPGRALQESEERLLLDTACSQPRWDAAFLAAVCAGNTTMRGAELKGLRIADLDLIEREVTVKKSKTDTGVRRIPLNGAAQWGFARLLERAHAFGSIAPEHFLLPAFNYRNKGNHGVGYDPNRPQKTWRTAWRALVKETARRAGETAYKSAMDAGFPPEHAEAERQKAAVPFAGLRFHDLRHLAITKFAESETPDATIMSISGHLNRAMMEHYSHVRAAAKRKAVDAIRSYVPDEVPPATKTVQ